MMPTPSTDLTIMQRALLIPLGCALIGRAVQVATEPDLVSPGWALLHPLIPLWLRITLWAVTGAVTIACGLRGCEAAGYAAAVLMPAERTISYAWSSLMWTIPGDPPGAVASFGWLAWWAGLTATILALAMSPVIVPWLRTWTHRGQGGR